MNKRESTPEEEARKRSSMASWGMICIVLVAVLGLEYVLNSAFRPDTATMLVGTYTGEGSAGVYSYVFNQKTGRAVQMGVAESGNPSFVAARGGFAYSVNEYSDGRQAASSFVLEDGVPMPLNSVSARPDSARSATTGGDPCNILTGRHFVATSNYTGGDLSVFPVNADGSLGALSGFFSFGPGAHIHCARFSPDSAFVFVADLGNDCIWRLRADADGLAGPELAWQGGEGLGPRHLVFDAAGAHAYLICELSDSLVCFNYGSDGSLEPFQSVLAYDGGGHGSADIHISADGRFLYTSHRLKGDGISVFRILPEGGVERADFLPTGSHPRNFALSPNGKWLLVACRDADAIEVYPLKNGIPGTAPRLIQLSKPVCIEFL